MKKTLLSLLALACIAVASQLISCKKDGDKPIDPPVKSDETCACNPGYRPNELIVTYKKKPTNAVRDKIKSDKQKDGIDPTKINIRACKACDSYVELWEAPEIHTTIHSDPIVAGSRTNRGTGGVGEDDFAYYSLNFTQDIPLDSANFEDYKYDTLNRVNFATNGKTVIRVAVLDTGIDTDRIIHPKFRWTNAKEKSGKANSDDDGNCYEDDSLGWNFRTNTPDVKDGNRGRHGTLISHYILNEFAKSEANTVEIMTLKTHDDDGKGDLFSSICAIHYAMENGANIINASWGFYYYGGYYGSAGRPQPYLDSLITKILRKRGILFVAAAGNKIDAQDIIAQNTYFVSSDRLRDLEYHKFYPAILSQQADNNVVTVTTADTTGVSPTQNYSSKYVDVGAMPDQTTTAWMMFRVPFKGPVDYVSGSSFATAIVTGKIAANLPKSFYVANINKTVVLTKIEAPTVGVAPLITRSGSLQAERIRKGRLTRHK